MDETAVFFCNAFDIIAGSFLDSFRAPVSTNVCENLCTVGQQFHEQHTKAV